MNRIFLRTYVDMTASLGPVHPSDEGVNIWGRSACRYRFSKPKLRLEPQTIRQGNELARP